MNRDSGPDAVLGSLSAHPYLWGLGICLFSEPLILMGGEQNLSGYALWLVTLLVAGAATVSGLYARGTRPADPPRLVIFGLAAVLAACYISRLFAQSQAQNPDFAGGWAALLITAFVLTAVFLLRRCPVLQQDAAGADALMIILLGFLLKLSYVLFTSVYARQHDVGAFEDNTMHAGYMEYLLTHHALPDFDVRDHWQFYHPPLHHAISAAWICFSENVLLVGHDAARESLQTLTLFYSLCIVLSSWRILRFFRLEGWALRIPLILISFHPAFILFSGSINNDVLSVAFIMGAVAATLEWYESQTMAGIIRIALCVGLGMMTKISAAIVAPAIALVFLTVLIKKFRSDGKRLMIQYVCFALVCAPLGLWFGLRNYILWGVPITYVPMMWTELPQYLGNLSFSARVTDFSAEQFTSPYVRWEGELYAQGSTEYNPLVSAMKTSLFGEWKILGEDSVPAGPYAGTVPFLFFWVNAALAGFALAAMIILCCRKSLPQRTEMLFLACFYAVMMVSFYKMAADYPFTCTMNFRYISPTAVVGSVFIGLSFRYGLSRRAAVNRAAAVLAGALAVLFASLSGFIYVSVA